MMKFHNFVLSWFIAKICNNLFIIISSFSYDYRCAVFTGIKFFFPIYCFVTSVSKVAIQSMAKTPMNIVAANSLNISKQNKLSPFSVSSSRTLQDMCSL